MTATDLIALIAALAAWVGLYFQRRSTNATEQEVEERLRRFQDIINRLETERATRERQIQERTADHLRLQRDDAMGELTAVSAANNVLGIHQIILFQQFASLYLAHRQAVDDKDPEFASLLHDFSMLVAEYIGRSNYVDAPHHDGISDSDIVEEIQQRVQNAISAFEKACERGQEMINRLESLGFVTFPDGGKLQQTRPLGKSAKSGAAALQKIVDACERLKQHNVA